MPLAFRRDAYRKLITPEGVTLNALKTISMNRAIFVLGIFVKVYKMNVLN
jgi:hypothetical protein